MKYVFIAGSRKFSYDIEKLVRELEGSGIVVSTAGKSNVADTPESEKAALLMAFRRIDASDVCYVYSKEGYVGRTVAMEIAYAYARKKEILSSEEIGEFSARALVSGIIASENLAEYCKKSAGNA